MRRIQFNGRLFCLSLLSGLLCHIYCMVNLIGTEDTLGDYSAGSVSLRSTFAGADTGRWLSGFVNRLQGWYRTPMFSGCLIILIMAVMAQVMIRFLHDMAGEEDLPVPFIGEHRYLRGHGR